MVEASPNFCLNFIIENMFIAKERSIYKTCLYEELTFSFEKVIKDKKTLASSCKCPEYNLYSSWV